jgi:ribosomal-protein-alanine N-acetyltransferase
MRAKLNSFRRKNRNRSMESLRKGEGWRLRAAGIADIDPVHALLCEPLVYRYLCDGEAPPRTLAAERIEASLAHARTTGLGFWILESPASAHAGAVELRLGPEPGEAELTYFLHPDHWHKGLATAMALAVIDHCFRRPAISTVFAGADGPNLASQSVMRRLGMRCRRRFDYPLGPGVEYVLQRGDPRPAAALPMPMVN